MTAIFTGLGAGLVRSSAVTLGGSGVLGSGSVGRGGDAVSVNAATGNLLVSQQDEFLTGRGLDIGISRTYNSLAELSDGDNGDNWQMSTVRRVFFDAGTDTVTRQSGDGSAVTYTAFGGAYRTTDGSGAYDTLTKVGATWVWRDGSSQITETYAEYLAGSDQFRITKQTDVDNQSLTFTYTGDLLDKVTTTNGEWVQYSWSGTNLAKLVTGAGGSTLTRTWYEYTSGRLSRVRVDLTPEDNTAPTDAQSYWTAYGYDGAGRVNLITQKDGSQTAIAYDGSGRVSSVTLTAAAGDTRVTSLVYGSNYTEVTGPDGQVTRLDYVVDGQAQTNLINPAITTWSKASNSHVADTGTYVDGHSVYEVSADLGAASSRITANYGGATPGETYTFTISLKAGSVPPTSQRFRFATSTGGTPTTSGVILDGPGQFVQESPGSLFWRLYGLSSTEATRVQFSGTIDTAGSVGNASVNIYSYYGGSYAAGEEFFAYDATYHEGTSTAGASTNNAGQLTKITAPPAYAGAAAQVAEFTYDTDGNLINTTAPGGGVTSYLYDANGNLTQSTSPDGKTVEYWYDSGNRVTRTRTYGSNASQPDVTQYAHNAYDSEGHLRYSVSAEGHVTEYRYKGTGLLQYVIEYPEHTYPVGASFLDEATLDAWRDAIVDKSSIKITLYNHDARGNQSWVLNYGYANVDGSVSTAEGYSRTYFTYDQAGKLLSRYNHSESAETFTYDGMGRLTASTNTAGGTTSIVFDDVNTKTVVTTASGYVTTQTYNKAGELISSTSSGNEDVTGTSTYQYDKNGQLKVSTDETGYESYYIYDHVGRKVADINGYGQLTEYRYDADNRVIATISYYNAMSAAKLALAADPAGTPQMSALRPTANSTYDIWTWTIYDADGRVAQSIDGEGGVTGFEYDNSGRLIKTTAYATSVAVAAYKTTPPTAPVTVAANAADMVVRTFYNRDGQLIGTLDGEYYLTEYVYDAAGQKIEEIAYANQTSSTYWVSGSFNWLRSSAGTGNSANRRVHHVYDGQGQLRYSVDNSGQVTGFTYNKAGKLTKTVNYATIIAPADYTYDAVKAAVVTNADDRSATLTYDSEGRVSTSTDAAGAKTTFAYDSSNRVIKSQIGTSGATPITRSYYTDGGLLRFTVDAEGYARRFDYDAAGRKIREVVWDAPISVSDTTTIANVNSLVGGSWSDLRWEYDSAGRVSSSYGWGGPDDNDVYVAGTRTYYVYNGTGQVADTYYAYGTADQSQAHFIYDGAGRVTHEYAAYGETATQANGALGEQSVIIHAYNGLGERISTTDARGEVTTFAYDERGQMVSSTNAEGGVTTFEYNAFGEVIRTVDPRGFETLSSYNALGQLTQTTDALNIDTDYTYTQFGEVASVTKAGAVTSFTYDKLGRVLTTTDANQNYANTLSAGPEKERYDAAGGTEQYTYDVNGNRTSVTNKLGGTTTYTYDKRGQLISETLPMASQTHTGGQQASTVTNTYEYDARGNRTKMVEADGLIEERITLYEYDNANRLVKTTGQAFQGMTPITTLAYDARGNMTRSTDPSGADTIYYYDDLGRVSAEINALGTYTAYTYDENGNVSTIKVYETPITVPTDGGSQEEAPTPSGAFRETSFTYDGLNRMTQSSVELPSGYKTGTLNGSTWSNQTTTSLDTSYEYDANGNVVKTTDPNGNITWAYYDALGRKTAQVDGENFRTNWTYDAEGNVTSEVRYANAGGTPTSTATPPSITSNAALDRTTNFTYDLNGNRLTETRLGVLVHNGSGGTNSVTATITYTYNGLGQVLRKTEATGDFVDYAYDTSGRLTVESRKAYNNHEGASVTPTVNYYYDGLGNLTRTNAQGKTNAADRVTTYGYDGGKLSWMKDAEAQDSNLKDGIIRNYQYDINGRQTAEYYTRYDTAGAKAHTGTYEAVLTAYDAMGRAVQQWQGTGNGTTWTDNGPRAITSYNAYGEVVSVAVGEVTSGGTYTGIIQQENKYDQAGRLWATNSGDGVWKFFGYDKNGNQTVAITSAGRDLTGLSFNQARGTIGQADVNATYTVYDERNMAASVVEEGRQLAIGGTAQTLTTTRNYNAFGEVASETNALGATVTYTYNKAGKLIRSESPAVEITNENGSTQWVKPAEDYYYDASGRLVATRDANGSYVGGTNAGNASSKTANTGNLTRLNLLTGTGYGGSQALVTQTIDAGGGVKTTKYDIHGDARTMISELGFETLHTYDKLGRLTVRQEVRGPGTGDDFYDYYTYDGLGQQIKHWNNFYNASNVEITDYDIQGRVISSAAFGGDETTISYEWDDDLVTPGLGAVGGWTQVTTYENNRTLTEKTDLFGRQTYKNDLGGNVTDYTYDVAGRLSTSETGGLTTTFTWLSSGNLGEMEIATANAGTVDTDWTRDIATYSYDAVGNRLTEHLENESGIYIPPGWEQGYPYPGYYYESSSISKNATATYDALGRLRTWSEVGSTVMPAASIANEYDAAGNIRHTYSEHYQLSATGAATTLKTRDHWFRFDAMHRVVVSEGVLSGGAITAGSSTPAVPAGKDIAYNVGGQRTSVTVTNTYTDQYGTYTFVNKELYAYDEAGRLIETREADTAGATTGTLRSDYEYNLIGQQTLQQDYSSTNSTSPVFSRSAVYNEKGQLESDFTSTKKTDGKTYTTSTTYYMTDKASPNEYLLGAVGWQRTVNGVTGQSNTTSQTINTYDWYDGAVQDEIEYDANIYSSSNSIYTTTFTHNAQGQLVRAYIADGKPHTATFTLDELGQVIAREETSVSGQTGAPHEIWYRYGGRELGYTGNNGTSDMAMSASISERQKVTPTNQGTFRNKQLAGTAYADFAQAYDPLNSYNQGSSSGSYTVQMGDTLQSIAQGLYGDSGLWYKIAEVNGLSAYSGLIEGQRLTLPAGVMNATHNASSFKAYDPSSTLGDVNPSTNPTPQKAKKGCGVFGTILLAVVAIAVTAVIKVPVAKFFAGLGSSIAGATGAAIGTAVGYAATGAAASMVSQSVGLATGIQDKFSWKAVGSAAVRSLFAPQSSGSFATDVINGVVNEAMYQGVATGIGLQNKFDWAGVAAAGISSGVGGQVRSGFGAPANDVAGLAQTVAVGAAEAISYAATRSALTGENFGRNIEAALPNVIASALVNGAFLALRSIGNSGAAQIEADAPTSENQATTGEQVSGAIINISGARNGGLGDYSVDLGASGGTTSSSSGGGGASDVAESMGGYGEEIVVTGRRGIDVDDGIVTGGTLSTYPFMMDLIQRSGDSRKNAFSILATRRLGYQDNAGNWFIDTNVRGQKAGGASLGNAIFDENPIRWSAQPKILAALREGALQVPEAAIGFETAAKVFEARMNGLSADVSAMFYQEVSDIGAAYIDIAGLMIAPIGALDASYEYSQGNISATELAINFIPAGKLVGAGKKVISTGANTAAERATPNLRTGAGYDAGDIPVRIQGEWSVNDLKQGLLGHPPRGLGSPDLHHGGQMPGGAKHEILPGQHRPNSVLHRNPNQGVTPEMRQSDRQLHWWYRAREEGADQILPNWIYD